MNVNQSIDETTSTDDDVESLAYSSKVNPTQKSYVTRVADGEWEISPVQVEYLTVEQARTYADEIRSLANVAAGMNRRRAPIQS